MWQGLELAQEAKLCRQAVMGVRSSSGQAVQFPILRFE